jgi:ATP-dependent 26S proteasome regulatory subunit
MQAEIMLLQILAYKIMIDISTWNRLNQKYLVSRMELLKKVLANNIRSLDNSGPRYTEAELSSIEMELEEFASAMQQPPAINHLSSMLGLSVFERDILLLCAGMELDTGFDEFFIPQQNDNVFQPSFGMALASLPNSHWSAISPSNPLRYWRLIEVTRSQLITRSLIKIDEHILHYLAGITELHERLSELGELVSPKGALVLSQQQQADLLVRAMGNKPSDPGSLVIHLYGPDHSDKIAIASLAASRVRSRLFKMISLVVPFNSRDVSELAKLWNREAVLNNYILFLDCTHMDTHDKHRMYSLISFIEQIKGAVIVNSDQWTPDLNSEKIMLYIQKPTAREQMELWQTMTNGESGSLTAGLGKIVSQFNLSASTIRHVATEVMNESPSRDGSDTARKLWEACCDHTRPKTDELAQRIKPVAVWDDIVLPENQKKILREIAVQVKQRNKVYDEWGFAAKGPRGLGISALFAGESGTGKTMASEVLANELNLDLYRIDLSKVVNKYIGETEKNLKRIFDAAEDGGAILLFDEADALFGKRSDVKDSHDRYSNIEVSYLLQRMESYRGLAILTTNMKNALDKAFLRRIRFVVQFPFPDISQRTEIWSKVFPANTPRHELELEKLARLTIAGGNIQNIAMNAAFYAADEDGPVQMAHIYRAAKSEFEKIERPFNNR